MRYVLLLLLAFSMFQLNAQQNPLVNSGEAIKAGSEYYMKEDYKSAIDKFLTVHPNDTNYHQMLHELALAYVADSQFEEAIPICEAGLSQVSNYEEYYYNTLGTAYDKAGKMDKAVETYEKGLAKFPYDYHMQYNIGYTYYHNDKYKEAFEALTKVLDNNPWHSQTHFILSMIALRQGHTTHALLSLSTSLLVAPGAENSTRIVGLLESISNNEEVMKADEQIKPFNENSEFEELDELVRSKIALNKEYKSEVKINAALAKQLQLVFEKLVYNPKSNDFWMKTYAPIFKKLADKQLLQPFIYSVISSVDVPEVQAWVKKNDSKIKALYASAGEDLNKFRESKTITENGVAKTYPAWYRSHRLEALGKVVGDDVSKKTGYWRFYHENGVLSSEGNYGTTYKKNGVWKYYDEAGRKTYEIGFANDVASGDFKRFHQNGTVAFEAKNVNGQLSGDVKVYFRCGALREQYKYVSGVKTGKAKSYYMSGQVESDYAYKEGEYDGPFTTYYSSGAKSASGTYKMGKLEGVRTEYYENGKTAQTTNYSAGTATGVWKFYHENGKLSTEVNYGDGGKFNGLVKRFYSNGNPRNEETYSSGDLHGPAKYYDTDGKLHRTAEYKKGKIVALEYFDKTGKSISKSAISSGEIAIKTFYPEGQFSSEGKYKGGDVQGEWKYYYRNGVLKNVTNFKDGVEQGKYIEYHENGKVKEEGVMKDGNVDGYFKSYYANGKLKSEGWMVEGDREGEWLSYHANGKLSSASYYIHGEVAGSVKEYTTTGKLNLETIYEDGLMTQVITFDSTGKRKSDTKWATGNGEEVRKYANGDTLFKSKLLCGEYDGKIKWFYPGNKTEVEFVLHIGQRHGPLKEYNDNGTVRKEGFYRYSDADGNWKWYNEAGKVTTTGNFVDDERDSVWTWYYDNGKVDATIPYEDGIKKGIAKYYDDTGELIYQKSYAEDMEYYQYMGANGQLTEPKYLAKGTGKLVSYFANGKKSAEEDYKSGYYDGKRMEYYANGNVHIDYTYKDNEMEGLCKEYYNNGKVKSEENYFFGYKHGVCKYYREDGTLQKVVYYILGDRYGKEEHYGKTGKLEKTLVYWNDVVVI